jgi:hypothetical protein
MLNGPFGVGKSTVAKVLRREIAGSRLYDPEWVGMILMRLPRWMLKGAGIDDFQYIALWRRFTVWGIRLFQFFASGPVIVPMTFSRRDYFDEVVSGVRHFDGDIRIFCLKANDMTLKGRLADRGDSPQGAEWITRRNEQCVMAQRDPHFGEPVETDGKTVDEVATQLRSIIEKERR